MSINDADIALGAIEAYWNCSCQLEGLVECSVCDELAMVIDAVMVDTSVRYRGRQS